MNPLGQRESQNQEVGGYVCNDAAWLKTQVAMLQDTGTSKDNIGQVKEEACVP